jgi:hypothetical protein
VTTRIITDDSGSRYSANGILKSPEASQVYTSCRIAPAVPLSKPATAMTDTTNDAIITRQAMPPETDFDSRRPKKALTAKPRSGRSGISSSMC